LVQDNAKAHRKEYLVKKCEEARSQEGNKPKAEKLRAIISSEYSAWLWPKLHRYAKGEIRTGLNRIEKPIYDDTGEIIEFQTISDSNEMFYHLLQRNMTHFSQAQHTPFVEGCFGAVLHPFQYNSFSESILQGKVDLSEFNINSAIKACMQEMAYPPNETGKDEVPVDISVDDFKSGFKTTLEKTSSSPSGRHLGHYRAALSSDHICKVYATLMTVPFKFGFTLQRWSNALQVMLEKVKGTPRLRVIQFLEADLNMSLQIVFGQWLIHRAEDGNNISPLQWGSRPNRSSTDAILMKHLTYDGINICKKVAIIFNNDGKAAFDRMIPSVGAIALCRLGSSENAVSALLQVLQQMKCRVCTALGISDQAYSNVQFWVLGTLQGSGASPCL